MFEIKRGNKINITRGDTAYINVNIQNVSNGDQYEIGSGDKVTMSVKKTTEDSSYAFQKFIIGSGDINIVPADTSDLEFGEYVYDIQIETTAGEVFTVVPPAVFNVMKEVTV